MLLFTHDVQIFLQLHLSYCFRRGKWLTVVCTFLWPFGFLKALSKFYEKKSCKVWCTLPPPPKYLFFALFDLEFWLWTIVTGLQVTYILSNCSNIVNMGLWRGLVNYVDTKAKCRHLKKFTCEGTLRQVFICLRPRTTYPPLHSVYVYYTYSLQGRGEGGELNQREGERGNAGEYRPKAGLKIPTWLNVHKKLAISCL